MAVKTVFSKQHFIEILLQYSLGVYRDATPLAQGTVQTNFLLQTTRGTFVFRYYENRSLCSVLFESNLIQYLKDKKYPCPAPLKNNQGKHVGLYNEKPYIIFEFIEGQHVEHPDEDQRKQLIEKVAALQNLTRNYRPRYKNSRWNYSVGLCRELAQKEAKRLHTVQAKEKLAWFENELMNLRLPPSLPKGICHCDFHFSNILFKDGQFQALIDFDDANYTFLTYDLVTLMHPFVPTFDWNTWSSFKKDESICDFQQARKTVAEYSMYRPLNHNEKRHLFDVYKLSVLFDCIWYFARGEVADFFERRKIDALNRLGREQFYEALFGG